LTLAGPDPSLGHRSLTVTGSVALNGTLQVITDDAFGEADEEILEVMTFASRSGNFATTEGLDGNPQFNFTPTLEATRLLLTVAAEDPPIAGDFARLDDTDGDGLLDLLETAFGGSPTDPACRRNPELVIVNGAPALHYFERHDVEGFTYQLQYSSDLKTWHDADGTDGRPGAKQVAREPFCELTDAVTIAPDLPPAAPDMRTFLRLNVSWKNGDEP